MAQRYDHLRAKAIELRTKHRMTLDEIIERLALPRGTGYYWIKDIPIERKQHGGQAKGTAAMQAKFAVLREAAYQQGLAEAPELLKDQSLRDFVVLYMAEGGKRDKNKVVFVNSDPALVKLAHKWMRHFAKNSFYYALQYHADHDVEELKQYWANLLEIDVTEIRPTRKSNSNQLSKRQFRSPNGLLSIQAGDTYFMARLKAWMDFIKSQW
jgi:hypothetical protein